MVYQLGNVADDHEGLILHIERNSIHDGQGSRVVLFLKGCPLSCKWCSTPESQRIVAEKGYNSKRCVGCGICIANCPAGALSFLDTTVKTDLSLCTGCFACVDICPEEAYKRYGKAMTVAEAVSEICKDEIFFFHSGGGITISGGECLLQPVFVAGVLEGCRLRGINTAIETSLFAPWHSIEIILPFLNILYVDLKHPHDGTHKKLTGVDNDLILTNLAKLAQSDFPFSIHLRIPVIPGVNDNNDSLEAVASIAASLKKLKEIEILPYHRLGVGTYALLGRAYELDNVAVPSMEYIIERAGFLKKQVLPVPVKVGGNYI